MSEPVIVTFQDGVAIVLIDNPPVNALSEPVVAGLEAALRRIAADSAVDAVVVIGAGRTFIAGADIKGLEQLAWGAGRGAPEMHDLLQRIEDSPRPVVMALHGTALGGGLEVAMAGHYRVAVADAQVGQPEVNLGIIPGAEGTQRLPRLVGVEKALEMCVSGRPIKAPEALGIGLIDRIIDGDLAAGAVAFAREVAVRRGGLSGLPADGSTKQDAPRKTRERGDKLPPRDALPAMLEAGRRLAAKVRRHQQAPLAAIDAIAAAATLPFEEGCARERELFFSCSTSEQCKALIHAFFAERAVSRVPGVSKEALSRDAAVSPVTRVGIVGAGTMGTGIAVACANAGLTVYLTDATAAGSEHGLATIRKNYDSSVKRGRLTADAAADRLGRIRTQVGYEGFDAADVIVEAVFESMSLKQDVFRALDGIAKRGCILATNTSTLDIDAIAAATSRPESVIGLHFFSPAHVMRLLEIVRGRTTSSETVAAALVLAKKLGKVGVVVGNCPGFVGNRMMFPYMYEAQFLVEEGATPEQVDRALTGFGMAMGIFAVDDMGGLDVLWRVQQELGHFADSNVRKPLVHTRLYEMGRLGQKTGKGWYLYGEDRTPAADPEVEALIEKLATAAGIVRRTVTDAEIVERCVLALINEGAKALDEGYALRASDIDVIYVTGYGFPAWRGGPLFYADRTGLRTVHDRIAAFHRELGPRWAPAPLLARLAAEGRTFREFDAGR
jgi:3-hydroxyacyl-CoA dehydrogenase